MYGLWEYLLKAKALAPINATRVLESGLYLKLKFNERPREAVREVTDGCVGLVSSL